MNATKPAEAAVRDRGGVPVPTVALLLGALLAAGILGYGLMLGAPGLVPLGLLGFAPLFAMTLVVASAPRRARPLPAWVNALLPVAAGLVTVTLLVGTFVLPGLELWWVLGAAACALPFVLLALAWPR